MQTKRLKQLQEEKAFLLQRLSALQENHRKNSELLSALSSPKKSPLKISARERDAIKTLQTLHAIENSTLQQEYEQLEALNKSIPAKEREEVHFQWVRVMAFLGVLVLLSLALFSTTLIPKLLETNLLTGAAVGSPKITNGSAIESPTLGGSVIESSTPMSPTTGNSTPESSALKSSTVGITAASSNLKVSGKKHYEAKEQPSFQILNEENGSSKNVSFSLVEPNQEEVLIGDKNLNANETFSLNLSSARKVKPGLYKLKMKTMQDGQELILEQNFTWGTLAINTHKSIYFPNDVAFISIGVLDDFGGVVCDANLTLEITRSNGKKDVLSTMNGKINRSIECPVYNVTLIPDYYGYYDIKGVGKYVLNLTADTYDGTRNIIDNFWVDPNVNFDVSRSGPTRIYPQIAYPMNITITPKKDYSGEIKEYLP
ncbi:MAG: hypothetical protein AABY26_07130, partial [Nanoarchaeota archaeon]